MTRILISITLLLTVLNLAPESASVNSKTDGLPRLEGAILLVGHPPNRLFVTTQDKTWSLQDDEQSLGGYVSPSISSDGRIIASARLVPNYPIVRGPVPLVVSTYSMVEHKWTDRSVEVSLGSIAISSDGTTVACVSRTKPGAPSRMQILNLKTGEITAGPEIKEHWSTRLSWSPNTRRIVFDSNWDVSRTDNTSGRITSSIYTFDLEAARVSKITKGIAPSWSPSGEWIAFIEQADSGNTFFVKLIHPDGTGARVLMTFRSDVIPRMQPVWSPDSKTILMNISRNPDEDTWDIYRLDLATLKQTKEFKNIRQTVSGWVTPK